MFKNFLFMFRRFLRMHRFYNDGKQLKKDQLIARKTSIMSKLQKNAAAALKRRKLLQNNFTTTVLDAFDKSKSIENNQC